MFLTLFIISLLGGFLSGFLGLGGALVIIPLMLTIPPIFGVGVLTMKTVSGLSMIQVFFSSLSGVVIHKKNRFVHIESLLYVGIPLSLASFIGSFFSKYISNRTILIIFGIMISFTIIALFVGDKKNSQNEIEKKNSEIAQNDILDSIKINKKISISIGLFSGILSGIVGAGGGFILIPLMINVLKIPIKITVGTSLGVIFIGSISGSIGKLISMQVEYGLILPIVLGSILASQFGAKVNKKTSPKIISYTLQTVLIISFIQILTKILKY